MLAADAGGRGCSLGGEIERDAKTASVRFGDDDVEYQVGVRLRRFRHGGFWAMLVCPRCDGGSQRLRLLDNKPACGKCVRASGLIYRSQSVRTEKRHAMTAPPRLAMLNSDTPVRIHPRPRGGCWTGGRTWSSRCGGRGSSLASMASIAPRIRGSDHGAAGQAGSRIRRAS
jgi:hypothetical protein